MKTRFRSVVMWALEIFLIIALMPYIVFFLENYSDADCANPGYACEADGS